MIVSKECSLVVSNNLPKLERLRSYIAPVASRLPVSRIDRATACACKAGDDNPWPQ
ncbi:hypothetical protein KKA02_03090 [Patescibacteria group bacterium]|nr:hypothetical protein [Patescibacteria group bacterium]MBU4209837.1 hypothetical protein [Patescibacteria group bacterium]MBU4579226.1 hypothetical protein [Patescibacteria group bacterium]MCG2702472.1 hypothetical protein [Candidatus Parcubacteria bacterium]